MEKVTCRRDDRLMHLILAMGMLWDTWLPIYQFAKQKIPVASHVHSSLLRQSHVNLSIPEAIIPLYILHVHASSKTG